jgi:uncharacterized repeat protein (TIGR01451 family)
MFFSPRHAVQGLTSAIWWLVAASASIPIGFGQNQNQTLDGLNFSPYLAGQNPNFQPQIPADQIHSRMQIVAPYTTWVRTFGSANGLEESPRIAKELGLKMAAGAWLGRDPAANIIEIRNLIVAANAGWVDIAVVGNEVLYRNDLSESQLIEFIRQVREKIPPGIPVATADVYQNLISHPNVIAASDVVFANIYPYWDGISVNNAVCALAQRYEAVVNAAMGKPVVLSETGWPSGGNAVGAAVPSPANAAKYFQEFVSWARANAVRYFYFAAFDEAWKAGEEGPQGAYWGVWDQTGVLKPGMQEVLSGQTVTVVCDGTTCGPGEPQITPCFVTPYGSGDFLELRACHVKPSIYKVACYIRVGNNWWNKPTFAEPAVPIQSDGTVIVDIVTGGIDETANQISCFLIPSSFNPPLLNGQNSLPEALYQTSVDHFLVSRSSNSVSGRIASPLNHPLAGVLVDGGPLGQAKSCSSGQYSFFNIPASGAATITPSFPNYTFDPPNRTLTINASAQTANFVAYLLADRSVSMSLTPSPVSVGGTITVMLSVSNSGLAHATGITASMQFPASFTLLTASTDKGSCSLAANLATCSLGSLTPTASAIVTITAKALAGGEYNLTAAVSGTEPDGNPENDAAVQSITVLASDLAITKTASGPFVAGGEAAFSISVSNLGPGSALGTITVTDSLPTGLRYVSGAGSGWNCAAVQQVVTCNHTSTLSPGSSTSFSLAVRVDPRAHPAVTNTAVVSALGDANSNNNAATVQIPVELPPALGFFAVQPCRVVDTRWPTGQFGGPALTAGDSRLLAIAEGGCAVPASARAYSFNVTVVPRGPLGWLTLWPAGNDQPTVSTLNSPGGEVVANAAVVPAGANGAIRVFATHATDVILDINGYFVEGTGAAFYAGIPCRLADTRWVPSPFGGPMLAGQQTRSFMVPSGDCGPVAGASSYAMNITAVPPGFLGYLTAWGSSQTRPLASTLNSWNARIVANAALVPAGANGAVNVFVSDPSHVILDISGHFGQPGGVEALSFYPVAPCRVADTRNPAGVLGGPALTAGTSRSFPVPQSDCGIPEAVKAYSLNVTVVPLQPLSYLTVWPAGAVQPFVSTLNSLDGSIVANAAIIRAGVDGAISIFATGATHVILDVNGYFQ